MGVCLAISNTKTEIGSWEIRDIGKNVVKQQMDVKTRQLLFQGLGSCREKIVLCF
jgi:hypothetical protein